MQSKKYLCCGIMLFNLPDDFNGTRADALRLVHYCYYNGVDEPSIYELEEI